MTNTFTGSRVDRLGNARKDEAAVASLLADPALRLVPVGAGGHLVHEAADGAVRASLPRRDEAPALAAAATAAAADGAAVLLGRLDGAPLLAVDTGALPAPPAHRFEELRPLASRLPADEAALLAQARGLLNWRRVTRFCANCGKGCEPTEGGTVMRCPSCATSHFPRTDPAVIMLVCYRDRALLARATRFEGRMFSTLAGFVEPGESLEEAVAREVEEECGIVVRDVRYHSSQPWPFPASIMLGFIADATGDRLRIDDDEIAEAAFFTRAAVADPASHGFGLPPPLSIARRMIDDWRDGRL